jgi:alpha-beta hydrolase superfamily lysophospholipase
MDFRGFGNTPGKIGHIKDLDTHLSDWWAFYEAVRAEYGNDVPIFGNGYSLGGATTYAMSIQKPDTFQGLIQIAPFAGYHTVRHHAQTRSDKMYK